MKWVNLDRGGAICKDSPVLDVPLRGVPVIRDGLRDLQAAADVGARPVLVRTAKCERSLAGASSPPFTEVFADLAYAVDVLIKETSNG